jgi:hypothetical protein
MRFLIKTCSFSVSEDIGMMYARTRICVMLCMKMHIVSPHPPPGTNVSLCAEVSKCACINVYIYVYGMMQNAVRVKTPKYVRTYDSFFIKESVQVEYESTVHNLT